MLIDDDLPVALPTGEEKWTARAVSVGPDERIDIAAIEMASGLTIATHRKIGWRYWPSGQLMTQDLNLEDTARQAVGNVLPLEPEQHSQLPAQPAGQRFLDETTRLGSLVHDAQVWPTRPVSVDGTRFALFVITATNGQAAVADLGPVRLALYGRAIPDSLALRLAPLRSLTLATPLQRNEGE